jgi:hypothetical protein
MKKMKDFKTHDGFHDGLKMAPKYDGLEPKQCGKNVQIYESNKNCRKNTHQPVIVVMVKKNPSYDELIRVYVKKYDGLFQILYLKLVFSREGEFRESAVIPVIVIIFSGIFIIYEKCRHTRHGGK